MSGSTPPRPPPTARHSDSAAVPTSLVRKTHFCIRYSASRCVRTDARRHAARETVAQNDGSVV